MNIALYKGVFSYGVVNYFAEELYKIYKKYGNNVYILDLEKIKYNENIEEELKKNNIDLAIGFNGIGTLRDDKFYDENNIVFAKFMVDHPFYHYDRIRNIDAGNKVFVGVLDEGSIKYSEKYIKPDVIYTHLMHGGSFSKQQYDNRKYGVAVFGGLSKFGYSMEEMMNSMDNKLARELLSVIYPLIESNNEMCIDEVIDKIIVESGIDEEVLHLEEVKKSIFEVFYILDLYKRKQVRYNAVKVLTNNGIKVDFFGNCELKEFNECFINHGPKDYSEILEIMAQSKIILHDIGYFKNGSHERVFSGMLNKALVISNENNYSYDMYKNKKSIVYYHTNNLKDLVQKVKFYLKNENKRNEIVENAYEITKKYNTWENRAEEILEVYNTIQTM